MITKHSVVPLPWVHVVKPFGTITRDFQFVTGNTRKTLEKLLEISSNYPQYVRELCRRAMSGSATDELVLLAIQHSSYLHFDDLKWKVLQAQGNRVSARPHLLEMKAISGGDWDTVFEAAEQAIDESTSEWESFLLLLHLYRIASLHNLGSPLEARTQARIEQAMESNRALRQYSPRFHLDYAIRLRLEGDVSLALSACDKGLAQALEVDDVVSEVYLLWQKAELIGVYSFGPSSTDTAKAILREATEKSRSIDCVRCRVSILSLIQVMCHMRGEYSEAYDLNLENLKSLESIGATGGTYIHNLSVMCNEMGNGREALEWAQQAVNAYDKMPLFRPVAHFDVAWSLVNLGRLSEAEEQMKLGREYLVKSGYESVLAIEQMVNGILERAQGDYESAMDSLERALDINLKENRHNRATSCMVRLAETEVMAFNPDPVNTQEESSGVWLTRLEKYGEEMDLPGVIGLVLLLKGQLRLKQGRLSEAQELEHEVRRMAELPGLAYLKDRIQTSPGLPV